VYLVQMGKAKFATPQRTEANKLVVRKYLYDLCRERGLLARHINDHLDIATNLVFVPSRDELTGLAIPFTERSKIRDRVRKELNGQGPNLA
jgi:siderophore synthetase component